MVVFPNELPVEPDELYEGSELEDEPPEDEPEEELEEGLELEEELEEELPFEELPFNALPIAPAIALPRIPPINPKLGM